MLGYLVLQQARIDALGSVILPSYATVPPSVLNLQSYTLVKRLRKPLSVYILPSYPYLAHGKWALPPMWFTTGLDYPARVWPASDAVDVPLREPTQCCTGLHEVLTGIAYL